jgi:hypothetical protein
LVTEEVGTRVADTEKFVDESDLESLSSAFKSWALVLGRASVSVSVKGPALDWGANDAVLAISRILAYARTRITAIIVSTLSVFVAVVGVSGSTLVIILANPISWVVGGVDFISSGKSVITDTLAPSGIITFAVRPFNRAFNVSVITVVSINTLAQLFVILVTLRADAMITRVIRVKSLIFDAFLGKTLAFIGATVGDRDTVIIISIFISGVTGTSPRSDVVSASGVSWAGNVSSTFIDVVAYGLAHSVKWSNESRITFTFVRSSGIHTVRIGMAIVRIRRGALVIVCTGKRRIAVRARKSVHAQAVLTTLSVFAPFIVTRAHVTIGTLVDIGAMKW